MADKTESDVFVSAKGIRVSWGWFIGAAGGFALCASSVLAVVYQRGQDVATINARMAAMDEKISAASADHDQIAQLRESMAVTNSELRSANQKLDMMARWLGMNNPNGGKPIP